MRQSSINIIQLGVILLAVMILIAILLPMLGGSRPAPRMQNSTQLRGIHQGLVVYANANKNYFPGLGPDGVEDTQLLDLDDAEVPPMQAGLAVDQRFAILLHGEYVTPEYLISPLENDPNIKPWPEQGRITTGHYSYAMLQIPGEGGRREEWAQTLNSHAVVLSDRNTGTSAKPSSIYSQRGEPWMGSVLWNDNHVWFESTDDFETQYGGGALNEADRLFESPGSDDALMVHTGN